MNLIRTNTRKLQKNIFKKDDHREVTIELSNIHSSGVNLHTNQNSQIHTITTNNSIDNDSLDGGLEFPEGGLKAYLVVFGSFMGLIPVFGTTNAIGAIETYVSTHQLSEVSTSTVSWIFSIYSFIAFASGIFSGSFFDRNGSLPPLICGTILFCGGLFITGNATTVYQFICGFSIVSGFGKGMLMSPLVGVISHYFSKKRAIFTSVAGIGGSVGGIVLPLLLKKLYADVGFAWAMRIFSLLSLFLLSISMILSRGRLERTHEKVTTFKQFCKVYFFDVFDLNSFKDMKFVTLSLGCALAESSLICALTYFPSYAVARGFNQSNSYLLITVINTTSIAGRYVPSYLADKWLGRFNVVITTLLMNAAVCLIVWLPFGNHLKVLYAFAALYGFCSGSIQSLLPVCAGQISKTSEFGTRYSTMYMFVAFGMLTFLPAGSAVIGDGTVRNYNKFIVYCSMLVAGSSLLYGITRYLCIGMKLKKF